MDENGRCHIFKTIMRGKRDGNPRPRLKDVYIDSDKGLLNASLPGPGIENSLNISHHLIFGIMIVH